LIKPKSPTRLHDEAELLTFFTSRSSRSCQPA
jgi:hypothetical protein